MMSGRRHSARPGANHSSRGHVTRPGTAILSPDAWTAPVDVECPRPGEPSATPRPSRGPPGRSIHGGNERDHVQIGYKGSGRPHTDERKPHDSAVHMDGQGALAVLCHRFGHSGPRSPPVRCQEVPPRPTRGNPTLEHRQESSTPAANLLDPLQPSFDTLHASMLVQHSHNTDKCHSTTREQERQTGGTRERHNDPHHKTTTQTASRSIGVNDNPNSVIS